MQVLDNFLDERLFQAFLAAVGAPDFPWQASEVNSAPAPGLAPQHNRQQVHGFYLRKPGIRYESPRFGLLRPVLGALAALAALAPHTLVKAKLNRTPRLADHVAYGLHVDTHWPGASTAILYLNTNDGYTLFEDGSQVASVANRLVLFDARRRHTGVSCTDAPERLVLNINLAPLNAATSGTPGPRSPGHPAASPGTAAAHAPDEPPAAGRPH